MTIVVYRQHGSIYYDIDAAWWMHVVFLGVGTPQGVGPFSSKPEAVAHAVKVLEKEGIDDYKVKDRTS
jgi:hypothetical protein